MKLRSICLVLALTACSNGIAPIPNHAATAARRATGSIAILITVPKKKAHRRRPGYISPSTQGITLSIAGPTNVSQTVALQPNAANCSSSAGATSCTLSIGALVPCTGSANCYVASITAYDAVSCAATCTIPATANKLSGAQTVAFDVVAGKANTLALVLGGVPASILVSPLKVGYVRGDASGLKLWGPAAQQLVAEAQDADGNVILGPGAPSISVSTSGANLTATQPAATTPNVFTLHGQVTGAPPQVRAGAAKLTIVAVPTAQSGGSPISVTVPVTIAHSAVYVATNTSILTYLDGQTAVATRTITSTDSCLKGTNGIAVNGIGTIFASSPNKNEVCSYLDGTVGPVAGSTVIAGAATGFANPSGLAIDSSGTLLVANQSEISLFAAQSSGNVAPSATIAGSATEISEIFYLARDSSGTIYVGNYFVPNINEYSPLLTGDVSPVGQLAGVATGLNEPSGMAIDTNGRLYVANYGNASVTEYAAGATGNASPVVTLSGANTNITNPDGVALDASGTLYVADYGAEEILEFANGASGDATPIATIPIPAGPSAIAVVPSL
jgi:sugar lactone lactonase YvrE